MPAGPISIAPARSATLTAIPAKPSSATSRFEPRPTTSTGSPDAAPRPRRRRAGRRACAPGRTAPPGRRPGTSSAGRAARRGAASGPRIAAAVVDARCRRRPRAVDGRRAHRDAPPARGRGSPRAAWRCRRSPSRCRRRRDRPRRRGTTRGRSRRGSHTTRAPRVGVEHGVDDQLAGDARDRRRARRVDVGDHDDVGADEGVGVLLPHLGDAVEAVGLEHGDDPPPAVAAVAGGGDDGGDLRRQVAVVVDERGAAVDAADVEAAGDAAEAGERRRGRRRTARRARAPWRWRRWRWRRCARRAAAGATSPSARRRRRPALDGEAERAVGRRARRRRARRRLAEAVRDGAVAGRQLGAAPGRRRRAPSARRSGRGSGRSRRRAPRTCRSARGSRARRCAGSCRAAAARGACRRSRRPRRRASSPPVQWAPVPASVTSPPTMKLGASPASARISISIDVVVVLPCVPATPIDRAWAQIDASIPARRSVGMPRSRAAAQLDVAWPGSPSRT